MPVLIGGSPSTGSSLLRQLLNRHSGIYCGPETQLFAYPLLFAEWEKTKMQLLRQRALTSPEFWLMRGVNLVGLEQSCTEDDLASIVATSTTFIDFCDGYFNLALAKHSKRIWAEKTPSNVLSFDSFLNTWNDGIVIHIVRDPKDVVASLMERGLTLFEAASRYLFNTSHGLITNGRDRNLLLKYEDLVMSTEKALAPALKLIGVKFEEMMTDEGNPNMTSPVRMKGWISSEIVPPNDRSIGRFSLLTDEEQNAILYTLNHLVISNKYAEIHGIINRSIKEISELTGYSFPQENVPKMNNGIKILRKQRNKYRRRCIRERRLFFEQQRPIEII